MTWAAQKLLWGQKLSPRAATSSCSGTAGRGSPPASRSRSTHPTTSGRRFPAIRARTAASTTARRRRAPGRAPACARQDRLRGRSEPLRPGRGDRLPWNHEAALQARSKSWERGITSLAFLEIKNLHVALEDGTEIVKGVDLVGRPEREARDHGPERLRQVDARLRADGPSGLRDHRGRDPARRREHRRGRRRRARAEGSLPRLPVPARDSGRDRHELPAERDQRDPQGEGAARTTRSRSRSSAPRSSPRWSG